MALTFRRLLAREAPAYEALGWIITEGGWSPSVGRIVIAEWRGQGPPVEP